MSGFQNLRTRAGVPSQSQIQNPKSQIRRCRFLFLPQASRTAQSRDYGRNKIRAHAFLIGNFSGTSRGKGRPCPDFAHSAAAAVGFGPVRNRAGDPNLLRSLAARVPPYMLRDCSHTWSQGRTRQLLARPHPQSIRVQARSLRFPRPVTTASPANRCVRKAIAFRPASADFLADSSAGICPTDSRAHARSRLMREIQGKESSYFLDWEAVEVPNQKRTRLLNPFQP
jgi:hypothetical protein